VSRLVFIEHSPTHHELILTGVYNDEKPW